MRRYNFITTLLAMLLITSCADDKVADDATPDGYGRLTITISTPEAAQTRAVSTTTPWLEGSSDERAIKSYHLLVCNGNTIIDAVSGGELALSNTHEGDPKNYYLSTQTITSNPIPVGTYNDITFYCLANFTPDMMTAAGLTVSGGKVTDTTLPTDFETKVMQPIANGISTVPTTGLPMTGKLTQSSFTIVRSTPTDISDPLILWRMMAKLEFQFTNQRNSDVQVLGIEVEPINQATASGSGVYLISQDNLFSLYDLKAPYYSTTVNQTDVTTTWALHDAAIQTVATVPSAPLISQAQLMWGAKLESTGQITANGTDLQTFKAIEKVTTRDERAAVIFTVKAANGLTFKPTGLSFKACRGGTDGGYFDVVVINGGTSTAVATGVRPERYNVSPYLSTYSYDLSSHSLAATAGVFYVKIYLYNLDAGKEYAFSDVVITGDVKNIDGSTGEGITLPAPALTDVGPVTYTPASTTIAANGGTGSLFFYVNETDATFTTTENQLSLRFKIRRDGYTEELRYGVTIPYIDGLTGGDGFNVIRRNDWIHIPIYIADWIFRVEPLAFVPIAGYPAVTVSSDALTTTFSTGGLIALKPFAQKNNDGTWRDFSDPEVTFVSLSWKNSDGTDVFGSGKIVKTAFTYDPVNHCVVGELNNTLSPGTYKTTLTINVKLGPSGSQYDYSFKCNVILQIPNP
jgi:hypothetical protein